MFWASPLTYYSPPNIEIGAKELSVIYLLQTQDFRADQEKESCIRFNTRELNRELCTG